MGFLCVIVCEKEYRHGILELILKLQVWILIHSASFCVCEREREGQTDMEFLRLCCL